MKQSYSEEGGHMASNLTYDDALSVCCPLDKPIYCKKYKVTVIFDGYLPDGTRILEESCQR